MEKFNPREVLEIAINMEVQGEAFYMQVAESSDKKEVADVLRLMAKDEKLHAEDFKELLSSLLDDQTEYDYNIDEYSDMYFAAFAKTQVFKDIDEAKKTAADFKNIPDAICFAIGLEMKTIGFYREVMNVMGAVPGVDKIAELIKQEQGHVKRLYELLKCKT